MKIIHIVGDSKWGGGGPILLALGEMVKAHGWHVDILTTDQITQETVRRHGFGVIDLDVIWRPIRPLRDLRGLYRLYRYLKSSDHDIVHTHTSKAGFVGRIAARMAGVPVVLHTVHGFAFHEHSSKGILHSYATLEKLAAKFCDRIVTVSEFHRRWALELGIGRSDQITAIPNGLDKGRVASAADPAALRRSWGVDAGQTVLLSPARLAPQKGLASLIRAIPMLKEQTAVPFRVVIAGDGPLRGELEQLAHDLNVQDRVVFLGFRKDVGDLLAASDIVVLPSLYEGLSISLLEAMAAGKPIVTTDIGSNLEVTRNGDGASIVPPNRRGELATAIAQMLNDATFAQAKAARGQQIYNETYTVNRMLDAYWDIYSSLADSAARTGNLRSVKPAPLAERPRATSIPNARV